MTLNPWGSLSLLLQVRLALPGYRERYYERYFVEEGQEMEGVVRKACVEYIR